ncbi:hypothetical protein MATR_20110 [Marivirga tractuosa]|uniref:Uncharacterized protein n=1 Tax=Marivirga tractuosa (strain ATCC 23168 / DSM 4126 / NBRC 15989 / NCIMB 1408 / VKM B-1430 / H-43) TaxID=643867 RepID=E4TMS2_MARTH|nr:hypothetical protein [Marivirga tractuosa]ADR20370.1 hypothetical protein Ftrac_0363 [Marivirga tractuosa DSM 4126]BDD15186.1 hypothetical protein MATR_20110 [Marivirga tractuosa]
MFEGYDFPKSLDEEKFEAWLQSGRNSKIGYKYMLIIWDNYDDDYQAVYVEERESIQRYERYESSTGRESLVAAYDLYSESRVS